ncbi:surface protein, partial [Lactobacillus apis]
MRKINNSKSKLLLSSSATLLLGLTLTNPQLVKADKATNKNSQTSTEKAINDANNTASVAKDAQTPPEEVTGDDSNASTAESATNSTTASPQEDSTNATDDDVIDGSFQGINLYYNTTNNVLTLTGGTRIPQIGNFSSVVLRKNNKDYPLKLAKKINIVGKVTLGTDGAKQLFYYFENVEEITGLDKLDTSRCTSFDSMFSYCKNLVDIDVSGMNTSSLIYASQMFFYCIKLRSIDLSAWTAPKLIDVRNMLCWDKELVSVKFINNTSGGALTYLSDLFFGCVNLTTVDLSKVVLNNSDPTKSTLLRAFQRCTSLKELDLSNLDMRNVQSSSMLAELPKLNVLKLGKKTRLANDCGLVNLGTWLNVGPGHSINNPEGKKSWSSKELVANYTSSADSSMDFAEDTYVLFGEPVTLQYLDENGSKIREDSTFRGIMGEKGVITAEQVPGYFLKDGQPPSFDVTYTEEAQTFKLVYSKAPAMGASVTVHYKDENGKTLVDDVILTGYLGGKYSSEEKSIPDYVLKDKPDNAKGYFGITPQEVTYVYTKVAGADVTVHFQDEAGKALADDVVLSGKLDASYEAKAKDITDYELVGQPVNATGTFGHKAQVVTFVYTKVAGANVTVHFQDEAGNTLAQDEILSGKLDASYEAKAKDITDYELVGQPVNASGTFGHNAQEVTFVYTKKAGANVTVHFQDESGNTLAQDEILSGKLDASYEAKPKDITDYELVGKPVNASGTFGHKAQVVTFVYTKVAGANVTVHFQDETGKVLADDVVLSGKLDASYEAKAKDITDYELVGQPVNASGTFGHKA